MSPKTPLAAIAIALIAIAIIPSFGQSYYTSIKLDPIPSKVKSGDTITFSGTLHTSDGNAIQGAVIHIKDDVDFGLDKTLRTLITDKNGKFYGTWLAVTRSSGAYDIYAEFKGTDNFSSKRSETFSVTVSSKSSLATSNSGYSSSPSGYSYLPTKITLDPLPSSVYTGQKITFSGKLTSNGKPIQNAVIQIKDEDILDFDDILARTYTDSQGRFSINWTVKDVDSGDRKLAAFLLRFVDPSFSIAPTVNTMLNTMEANTIEVYAEFSGNNNFRESTTCTSSSRNDYGCTNRILVIRNISSSIEDKIVSLALGEIIPGGGTVTQESDLLYSVLSSGEVSEHELKQILAGAIESELGISGNDMTIGQMLALLDDVNSQSFDSKTPKNYDKSKKNKIQTHIYLENVKSTQKGKTVTFVGSLFYTENGKNYGIPHAKVGVLADSKMPYYPPNQDPFVGFIYTDQYGRFKISWIAKENPLTRDSWGSTWEPRAYFSANDKFQKSDGGMGLKTFRVK